MVMEDGAPSNRVLVIAVTITLAFVFFFTLMLFTGMAVYWIEENNVAGEALVYPNGTWGWNSTGDFTDTWDNTSNIETITGSNGALGWDYYIIINNKPAKIEIFSRLRSNGESINFYVYNHSSLLWTLINTIPNTIQYTDVHFILDYPSYNVTEFVNNTGYLQILFNDSQRSVFNTLLIDYLAINVTVSPLDDLGFLLVNETGESVGSGVNVTRAYVMNASALWNASGVNSSYAWINYTGGAGGESLFQFPHYDLNDNWTNCSFDFSNYTVFPVAGNVSVRLKAFDGFYQQNWTRETLHFSLWGNASIGNISINQTANDSADTIANGTDVLVRCQVSDDHSNSPVPAYNVSFHAGGSYLGWSLTNSTGWATHSYKDNTQGYGYYNVTCNITDDGQVYYHAGNVASTDLNVTVITDTDNPVMIDHWIELGGVNFDRLEYVNLFSNVSIVANITDPTTSVESVDINVTYPDTGGSPYEWQMTKDYRGLWTFNFSTAYGDMSLNSTGGYTFYFRAYDVFGNSNETVSQFTNITKNSFTVLTNMTINLMQWESNDTTYNRGENLTFSAYDVNGFIMENANWSLLLLKYNSSVNDSYSGEGVAYYNYTLNASAPPGNWTVWVNSSQMGNNGSLMLGFNVSDELTMYFYKPDITSTLYSPTDADMKNEVKIRVNYSRGGSVNWNLTINLTCSTCQQTGPFTLIRSGDDYVLNDYMKPPNSYDTAFSLTANLTYDPRGNTADMKQRSFKTNPEGTSNPPSGGRTSTTGVLPPACNCTEYADIGCGAGDCLDSEMYQERVCTPAGCSQESRCIGMPKCTDIKNFNITKDKDTVAIKQGKNGTVVFSVENTGNKDFDLAINLAKECCEIFPRFESFELPQKTQISVPIVIHAPLTEVPGEYVLTVKFTEKEFEKMDTVRIVVEENEMLQQLDDLEAQKQELENEIGNLERLGIDVTGLKRSLEELENNIAKARKSISEDDIMELESYFGEASSVFESIEEVLMPVRLQGFLYGSGYKLAAALVLFILMLYMLTQVILPPYTINRRIKGTRKRLEELRKVRSDTMKQYFNRKIDEATRDRIIAQKKAESNTLEVRLKELEKEKETPMESKLSPGALGRWMVAGPRRLIRRKPKASRAPERKEKMNKRMAEVQRMLIERQKKGESKS